MATTVDFIEYVCEQIQGAGAVRYRKMFGEYMVYVNDKPVLLVCDNTVYVKKLPCVETELAGAAAGVPYEGAKEHYVLNIDDRAFAGKIAAILEAHTPVPKPRPKKKKQE